MQVVCPCAGHAAAAAARYYGMSAKEEAAHVRHVKRFAKVLFFNIKGEADR